MLGAICGSAQSMDRAAQSMDPYFVRRNPWIAQESVDRAGRSTNFAYDTIQLVQTCMDGLVISTNLKFNNFTHFNGIKYGSTDCAARSMDYVQPTRATVLSIQVGDNTIFASL